MVECIAAFVEVCYLVRQDDISTADLDIIKKEISRFHHLWQVFIDAGVRDGLSLPQQHALMHYPDSIALFGSPNGLHSSITEAKHIKAIKEPWRRSSRNKPLPQMLETVMQMEKMATLRVVFEQLGMLRGSTSMWEAEHRQAFGYEDSDDEGEEIEKMDEQDTPSCYYAMWQMLVPLMHPDRTPLSHLQSSAISFSHAHISY
jgi:hypothetical protein